MIAHTRPLLASLGLLSVACGAPEKLDPIDLEATDSPTAADFSSDVDLLDRYATEVEQPWLALGERSFEGVDGITIRYRVSPVNAPRGVVVLLGGRTEAAFKHAENVFDLNAQGYTVYSMDHRGHGASDRLVEGSEVCHVEFFMDYVRDLEIFVDSVVLAEQDGPVFVVAHSMGAAVAALLMWDRPELFDGAVLSSPMFGIDTGVYPQGVAQTLSDGFCASTAGTSYTLGHGDYDDTFDFEGSSVTQSEARYTLKMALYDTYPELRVGGASWRWVCESLWAAQHLERLGRHTDTRTLVLRAGDERVVLPEAEASWCDDAPGCQLVDLPGARHEIFSEADLYRNEALTMAVRYLDALVEAM
jgi:lysophospholipase